MAEVYLAKSNLESFQKNPKLLVKFLEAAGFFSCFSQGEFVGIKIHFGEDKNKGYIKPHYIKALVERIKRQGGKPFLFDTNTLYRGRRMNTVDHFNLAFTEHNFKSLGVPIIIADGLKSKDYLEVDISGKHFSKAKVVPLLRDIDCLLVLSHLTGHMLTGFGASMKNLGMGCASRAGKMQQHCEVSPTINHKICILCRRCLEVCSQSAISVESDKIFIDQKKCSGCAQCLSQCPKSALKIVWSENYKLIQEKMVEYALAGLSLCQKSFFVNFAMFITKDCDCMSREDRSATADLGLLASRDVLSLDKATIELLNKQNKVDVFRQMYSDLDYNFQFQHASKINLGDLDYEIREFKHE